MNAPIILFDNYMLRDVCMGDYLDLYEYGSDIDVIKFLSWGPFSDINEAKHAIRTVFLSRPKRGLPIGYAIIDLTKKKMIGTVDFHTIHDDNLYEIGYALNKNYWNKGIMTKAVQKLVELGFFYFGYERILLRHSVYNVGSRRVIEKNNFKYVSSDKNGFFNKFTQAFEETKSYILTKEDFLNEFNKTKGDI